MLLNFHEEKFESLWFLTKFVIVENSKEYFVLVKTTIFAKFLDPYINVKLRPIGSRHVNSGV